MTSLSRRNFLKASAATSILTISIGVTPKVLASDRDNSGNVTPCLRFTETGETYVCVPVPDMGQGMVTTAAQLIAEELDLDLNTVNVEMMAYQGHASSQGRAVEGDMLQGAGGSLSTSGIWVELRRTAAFARALFIEAASAEWGVPKHQLTTKNGTVTHKPSGRAVAYVDLVALSRNAPETLWAGSIDPKPIADHKVIGRDQANLHAPAIVKGEPLFSIDVDVPGMMHACIRRCPHLNGRVASFDREAILRMPGVRHIVEMKRVPEDLNQQRVVAAGVAVIADTYWQARKAADALEVEWDGSRAVEDDTAIFQSRLIDALDGAEMQTIVENGDVEQALTDADVKLESTYSHPHWAHTCIEPHNCVADVKADGAEIWVGHQSMTSATNAVLNVVGLPFDKVKVNIYRMGTGFGRKYVSDFVHEAVHLSKEIGAPVKVTWSREDEIEQDYLNPIAAYRIRAGVSNSGRLEAWHIRAASDGYPSNTAGNPPSGLADNYLGEAFNLATNTRLGAWRGPQHNTGGFVIGSMLDELAHEAGIDPLEFLMKLYNQKDYYKLTGWPYTNVDFARYTKMLEKVASEANWGKRLPEGWGQGIALHQTFSGVCAHVVELEMTRPDDYRVHRVTSAVDCGLAVNPLGVRAQIESGVMDGLCAAKYGKIVFEKGVPTTNNFDTYRKMRINEAPAHVDTYIMDFGDTEPRGTGEVSLPPVIPALTNAIFAASGKRVRNLPISENL